MYRSNTVIPLSASKLNILLDLYKVICYNLGINNFQKSIIER